MNKTDNQYLETLVLKFYRQLLRTTILYVESNTEIFQIQIIVKMKAIIKKTRRRAMRDLLAAPVKMSLGLSESLGFLTVSCRMSSPSSSIISISDLLRMSLTDSVVGHTE